jgi:hypothetical protein
MVTTAPYRLVVVVRQAAAAARSAAVPSRAPLVRGRPRRPVRGGAGAYNTALAGSRVVQVTAAGRLRHPGDR